jgi:AcrR family transcriptional regulator
MSSEISLRERKRIKTQMQLADKAIALFLERGYDNVTVDEIADAVEVSPRTFYRYYPAKEDVLFPYEQASASLLRDALMARPREETSLVAVKNALLSLADDFEQRKEPFLKRMQIVATTPALQARSLEQMVTWERILAAALAERRGTPPETLAPRLIAAASVAGLRVALETWLSGPDEPPLADLVVEVLDRLDSGLRAYDT